MKAGRVGPLASETDWVALPITLQSIIPQAYADEMGHMNAMWYTHLFYQAAWELFGRLGLGSDSFQARQTGIFAAEAHYRYMAEVLAGQPVTVRTRLLGRSAKLLHFLHLLVLDDGPVLAATAEYLAGLIDLKTRRACPFEPHRVAAIDRLLAEHARLPGSAAVCGIMQA
jgi:acyl-CoA thioesterase FadM